MAAVSPAMSAAAAAEEHRRTSLEEDYFYREVMTVAKRPTEPPPSYESTMKKMRRKRKGGRSSSSSSQRKGKDKDDETSDEERVPETLPAYSCDLHLEGVFQRKMEIENTTQRAEDRRWSSAYVVLHGTALEVYRCRKDRTWVGRTAKGGPGVSPDRPPWLRRGALEKSYNLTYADVGIAADYVKRRYVIRVRAETDQFLLACIELETFVRWLDVFFAALSVALPIDERDFPRDQSIPRLQRIRWYTGQDPTADARPDRQTDRQGSVSSTSSDVTVIPAGPPAGPPDGPAGPPPALVPMATRLSTTNYPHDAVDAATGKWQPRHPWTRTHDMVYAKLCYATLLFRSPRKSNYIVMKGKQWVVDWTTGNMSRVSPPRYGEIELFGPWQVIRTENARI